MKRAKSGQAGAWSAIVVFLILAFIALAAILDARVEINTGHVGIETKYGAATGDVLQPGVHWIQPFVAGVVDFDTHQQSLSIDAQYTSHDQQKIPTVATIVYQVNPADVPALYKAVGTDYADIKVKPLAEKALNLTLGQYDAEQLSTDKTAISNYLQTTLTGLLKPNNINVISVTILTTYPQQYQDAVEAKQTAQQQVLTAQQALAKTRVDAQAQVVQAQQKALAEITLAKADAQAQRLRLENLSPLYIEYEFLQAWDGKLPTYSSGQLPFFTVPLTGTDTPAGQ